MLAKQFHSLAIAEKQYQSLSQAASVSVVPTISQPSVSTPTISLPQIPNVSYAKLTVHDSGVILSGHSADSICPTVIDESHWSGVEPDRRIAD